ncbi:MAG: isochorismatase family cysteine hydrolase [Halobacteria archaeon]|nr:isochorismatase family cysteine hydrolase [Halobacteria archaeon]
MNVDYNYTAPDSANSALLTIDVQNDFTLRGAPAEIEGTQDAVPQMKRLVQLYRDAAAPVVHVVRLYKRDGSNVDMCRREAIENGETVVAPETEGAEIVDELVDETLDAEKLLAGELQKIGENEDMNVNRREWAMYKPRWGAFYDTPLDNHLSKLSVNTLVVCGCDFPNLRTWG